MQKPRDIEIDENDIFKNDLLGRQSEIENLTPIILNFDDPLVLALDSPWGSGKTTFVKLWQACLEKEGKQSICFNAWETDYAEDPLIVLVSELNKWLKTSGNKSVASKFLEKSKKVLPSIAKQTAIAAIKIVTLNAVDGEQFDRVISDATGNITGDLMDNFNKQSESIEQFKKIITEALDALPSDQKNLVIFIDELDRCRPTYAIELLERIKHLFSIKRLVFVLSTDTIQLSHSIRAVYGNDFDAKKYLQRFIDLDYSLKKPEREKYIDIKFEVLGINQAIKNRPQWQNDLKELKECFVLLVKRFDLKLRDINLLLMRIRLILYSIPNDYFLDQPLLVSLLILRDQNKELYDQYINSPNIADKVIEFLCQGFLPLNGRDYTLASIIGYLIATNWNKNEENKVFEHLIEPYRNKATDTVPYDMNRVVVNNAENPRGQGMFYSGIPLNLTVERIELVHRINIEI